MAYTIVVTIGRKVGQVNMDPHDWKGFKVAVNDWLAMCGMDVVQRPPLDATTYSQEGTWKGEVFEEAASFVALYYGNDLASIRARIHDIGNHYGQEAVGFIYQEGTENFA